MSSTGTSRTWSIFLSDLSISGGSTTISGEELFHREFKRVCSKVRERDPERLLARFLRHHDQIVAFVSALDNQVEQEAKNCLSSVFWSKAFEAIEKALANNQKDKLVREYLPHMAEVVPAFGPELTRFPQNEAVQLPLQSIFRKYIACYDTMLRLLESEPDHASYTTFLKQVESVTQEIADLKQEWETLAEKAKNDFTAARKRDSQYSYYSTTVGPYNPSRIDVTFEWQETLGSGTFGQVHKVRETSTGTFYAQKVMHVPDTRVRPEREKAVLNEVAIMQKLRHHHIASVQFHVFAGDTISLIMLPVADYDLRRFLRQCTKDQYPRTELIHLTSWFGCLVGALAFAHSKQIKHEDIKPGNILLKDHQPYLADFGCAKDFSNMDSSVSTDARVHGTPIYWAPEDPPRGRSADVFSLGCVFSEMLTVRHKHSLEEFQEYRRAVNRENPYAFRNSLDKVIDWLEEIIPDDDEVGNLLQQQTAKMMAAKASRRKEASFIKKRLRIELDSVFCSCCH